MLIGDNTQVFFYRIYYMLSFLTLHRNPLSWKGIVIPARGTFICQCMQNSVITVPNNAVKMFLSTKYHKQCHHMYQWNVQTIWMRAITGLLHQCCTRDENVKAVCRMSWYLDDWYGWCAMHFYLNLILNTLSVPSQSGGPNNKCPHEYASIW